MRSAGSLTKFSSCRLRLQRAKDAKAFHGRIKRLENTGAVVVLNKPGEFEIGDTFVAEAHGPTAKAIFAGRVLNINGASMKLQVMGDIRQHPPTESARIVVPGMKGILHWEPGSEDIEITDISREGLGLIASEPAEEDSEVEVDVFVGDDVLKVKGTVRYSRELGDLMSRCQIGVKLELDQRLISAKWLQLFEKTLMKAA